MPTREGTDGGGGLNQGRVDAEGRAVVRADIETDLQHAMGNALGYTFHSSYSLTGGEEAFYLKNTADHIHVAFVVVSTSATGLCSVQRQTSGTAAGTAITGKNGLFGRPVMPGVVAFGNASVTGSVDGDIMDEADIGTSVPHLFPLNDFILENEEALFVRFAETAIVHVTAYVFRETE